MSTTVDMVKRGTGIGQKLNIPAAERKMIFGLCWATALDIIFLTKYWARCFILALSTSISANCIWKTGTYERISESKKQFGHCG